MREKKNRPLAPGRFFRFEGKVDKSLKRFDYREALQESILIFDGAMGTNLQKLSLTAQDYGGEPYTGCNDVLILTKPDAVEKIHRSFLEVGVDAIETNTFRSNRLTLSEYGLQDRTHEINFKAAQLARQIAASFSAHGQRRYVAGSIGPSGKILSVDNAEASMLSFEEMMDVFKEQAVALLEGGVDVILLETQQDLLEVKAAILGVQQACRECDIQVPLQVQTTMDVHNRMLFGSDIEAVAAILEPMGIDVLGLNCSTGPDEMEQPIRFLGQHIGIPVSCIPNAGMPEMSGDTVIYPLEPVHFARKLTDYVEQFNISVVGGCCGTTPEHLKLLVENVHGHPITKPAGNFMNYLSSPIHARAMRQSPAPFIIGERLNTQGSRNFKRIILDHDFDRAQTLANQQIADGAHGLDLCTALTENDLEKENLVTLIRKISHTVDAPLVIDSTDPSVMEAALQATPGRCLINSTHFESGNEKAEKVFQLAMRYGATVIVLTIDEQGMAKSANQKLDIVKRAYHLAVDEIGLPPQSLVFDPLTFSLASGDADTLDSAQETLSAIRQIKAEYAQCPISLGISNISYGFSKPARKILNSVFLYHAIQAGLDMAILNAADLVAYPTIDAAEKKAAEQLIFNTTDAALTEFIHTFSESTQEEKKQEASVYVQDAGKRISWRITNRVRDQLEQDIEDFIKQQSPRLTAHQAALTLLNDFLLPAMKEVGDQFSKGEIILPFVLQSSEIMRAATIKLEDFIEKNTRQSQGTVLLATVYGDVHDIGKNLVKTILENNGYSIIDMGKQVPADDIIATAIRENVTAVGLSALLVNTSQQMPLVVKKLHDAHSHIPVLIGGAAVNQAFADRIEALAEKTRYMGGVYFCRDAFDALDRLEQITNLSGGNS